MTRVAPQILPGTHYARCSGSREQRIDLFRSSVSSLPRIERTRALELPGEACMVNDSGSDSLRGLLDEGWGYHDKESERLADQLEAAAEAGVGADLLAP